MRAEIDQTEPRRARPDLGELVLALAVVAFGAAVVWQTTQIRVTPAYSKVGPRVIPYIVGVGLVLLGVWLAAEAATRRGGRAANDESEDADPTRPTDWRVVGMLAVTLVVYGLLIEPAGFVVASALLFAGAAFSMGSRRVGRDAAVGFVFAVILYVGFTRGIDLDLPAGVLDGVL